MLLVVMDGVEHHKCLIKSILAKRSWDFEAGINGVAQHFRCKIHKMVLWKML